MCVRHYLPNILCHLFYPHRVAGAYDIVNCIPDTLGKSPNTMVC